MAEIKIEKKKHTWLWILLVLLVLFLIWFFLLRDSNEKVIEEEVDRTEQVQNNVTNMDNSAIAEYSTYIGNTAQMGIDHEYSNGALNLLIDAVEEKADMLDVDVDADLEEARNKTAETTTDPYEVDHADLIRSSGEIITRALTTIQEAKFPNLADDVAQVDEAIKAIKPSVKTLDQKDDVNKFFMSSESLLLKMQ